MRGICWSTSPNPKLYYDRFYSAGIGTGVFNCNLQDLYPGTLYYARAFASNTQGTAYGNEVSFSTKSAGYTIGQAFGGGMIFYIDSTGQHGLIADTTNAIILTEWGCDTIHIGTRREFGTGQANTLAIVNKCSQPSAARFCYDLVLNGYDDWFLPSLDELVQYCRAQTNINGYWYYSDNWTSTEASTESHAQCHFCGHQQPFHDLPKTAKNNVLAVRAF
jgi:hypothetical protein